MPFTTLTRDEIEATVRATIRNLIPGADVSEFSDYDITARMVASVFLGNQAQAEYVKNQILPTSADEEFLILHAAARGMSLRGASAAKGYARISASSGTPSQLAGSTITHDDGTVYTTDATVAIQAPGAFSPAKTIAAGSTQRTFFISPNVDGITALMPLILNGTQIVIVKDVIPEIDAIEVFTQFTPPVGWSVEKARAAAVAITAQEAGRAGNKVSGDSATLDSPATNVNAAVELLGLSGGADLETLEELRRRVAIEYSAPRDSGNLAQIRQWALDTPDVGIEEAFVFPGVRGIGTVDVVPFGVSGARETGANTNALIQAYIDEQKGALDDIRVVGLERDSSGPVDVEVTVTCNAENQPDFSGSFTLNSAAGTIVSVSPDPSGTIEVGDRIIYSDEYNGRYFTEQRTVVAVSPGFLTIDSAPTGGGISTSQPLLPGSPNSGAIVEAINALFDDLGPAPEAGAIRFPAEADGYGSAIYPSTIAGAVMSVPGVLNCVVDAPTGGGSPSPLRALEIGSVAVNFA